MLTADETAGRLESHSDLGGLLQMTARRDVIPVPPAGVHRR